MAAELQLNDVEKSIVAGLPDGEAAGMLAKRGLPSKRDEQWKWSDLRASLREVRPLSAGDIALDAHARLVELKEPLEFVFANGTLARRAEGLPDNVTVTTDDGDERLPGAPMALMALQGATHTHVIRISGTLTRPLHLRYLSEGGGMHQTSVEIVLEDGAQASLVESLEGREGAWFANDFLRIRLGEGASLERLIFQEANDEAVIVHHALVELAAQSAFTQGTLGFGAKLTRLETQLVHQGEEAKATLNGAYLLDGRRHLDNTTSVTHAVPDCVTEELYKGVLTDRGRGVFQGKFHVARDAQKTDARMAHNALLLSETAQANAKPELEIYADDVQCEHGNTAGALDEEALFYMRQRGLSEREARALLVQAFVAEAFDYIADEDIREQIARHIDRWLEEAS